MRVQLTSRRGPVRRYRRFGSLSRRV